jgi:hypothetical protein
MASVSGRFRILLTEANLKQLLETFGRDSHSHADHGYIVFRLLEFPNYSAEPFEIHRTAVFSGTSVLGFAMLVRSPNAISNQSSPMSCTEGYDDYCGRGSW